MYLIFLFLPSLLLVSSQDSVIDKDKPLTLDKHDVVARGKMSRNRGKRPVQITRMDNNGEILVACLEAKLVNSPELKNILGMETQAQAAMFLHYEIRYAFLEYLLEKRTMEAPVDFKN